MRTRRSTVTAAAVASALLVLLPTAAQAATYTSTKSAGGTLRATAKFVQDGDRYTIKDEASDGKSAILLKSDANGSGYYPNTGGAGSTLTIDPNLPEGSTISFAACYGESSNPTAASCATVQYHTA